ncbi:MAG TPA: TolC family protein [Chthoniobacterales bacterium]|jgi:outer membrane protein|nr:TolC family protein [Chthoniobacterales bacterium]
MIGRLFLVLSLASCCGFAKEFNRHSKDLLSYSPGVTAPQRLTLDQAESIAFRQAPFLGRASFETQAAQQVIREARSGLFPQVIGDVSAVGTSRQNIRIGASGGLNNPTILNRQSNGINISQLIFDFGRTLNLTAAAKFQALSEAQQEELTKAQVLLQVDRSYFDVLKALALLRVANETVSSRQVIYDEIAALAKSKLKSALDQTYARANLEQANQLVLQANNAVGVAYSRLSESMGYHTVQKFSLSDPPPLKLPDEKVELLVSKALQIRPEVVALRDQVKGAQREAAAAFDARFPRIEALGSIGRTTVGAPAVYGDYGAAGIDVEVPLFTGGLFSARQKEAALRASAQQKALDQEENQVVEEVNSSWLDAFTAFKNIGVAEQLAASAQQALELASAEFRAGQTSIIELSQAQLNALQAEIAAASAKYDYEIDRVQLDYQSGALPYRVAGKVFRGVVPIGHR